MSFPTVTVLTTEFVNQEIYPMKDLRSQKPRARLHSGALALAAALTVAWPTVSLAQTTTVTQEQRDTAESECFDQWMSSNVTTWCELGGLDVNDFLNCRPQALCTTTPGIYHQTYGWRWPTYQIEIDQPAGLVGSYRFPEMLGNANLCYEPGDDDSDYALRLAYGDCPSGWPTAASADNDGLPYVGALSGLYADAIAQAAENACAAKFQSSPAATHCTAADVTVADGRCVIETTCTVNARIMTGYNDSASAQYSGTTGALSVCSGTGAGCWFGARGVHKNMPSRLDLCVAMKGSGYQLRWSDGSCPAKYIAAADALAHGVPNHTQWNRRNEELAAGIAGNTSTNGALPAFRQSAHQRCVDAWLDSEAAGYCTLAAISDYDAGHPRCYIDGACSVSADIVDIDTETTLAEGVTWTLTLASSVYDSGNWAWAKVDDTLLCFAKNADGSVDDPASLFNMTIETRCQTGEDDADTATSSGLAWSASD